MTRYTGDRTIDGVVVKADGKQLSPRYDRLRLTTHGFEWSYEGPEPAQLAFALLLDHLNDTNRAEKLHNQFMTTIVANFDNEWEMTSADIDNAIVALSDSN